MNRATTPRTYTTSSTAGSDRRSPAAGSRPPHPPWAQDLSRRPPPPPGEAPSRNPYAHPADPHGFLTPGRSGRCCAEELGAVGRAGRAARAGAGRAASSPGAGGRRTGDDDARSPPTVRRLSVAHRTSWAGWETQVTDRLFPSSPPSAPRELLLRKAIGRATMQTWLPTIPPAPRSSSSPARRGGPSPRTSVPRPWSCPSCRTARCACATSSSPWTPTCAAACGTRRATSRRSRSTRP